MKKRIIIATAVIVALTLGAILFYNAIKPETYTTAKASCEKILKKNSAEMEGIAVDLLNDGVKGSGYYKECFYSYTPGRFFVPFDIDCQGMLWRSVLSVDIYQRRHSLGRK